MRFDDEVAVLARSDGYGDCGRKAALGAQSVEHLAHGADVNGVVLEHFDERILDGVGALCVEELQ